MADIASLGIRVTTQGIPQATQQLDKLDTAAERVGKTAVKIPAAWKALLAAFSVGTVAGVTRSLVRQADEWNNIKARIELVTKSSVQLLATQAKLFGLAQRTGGSYGSTADLYVKLAQSSDRLRDNQEELLQVTELVNKSLVVSGANAASADAVTRQFAQALAAGALRGDEFVSVMEGAPRLARAIAEGLDVSVGKLRELAKDGKLTADTVTNALLRSGRSIDEEFGKLPLTIGRSVQMVENSILQLIGKTDDAGNSSRALANAIAQVAKTLSDPATVSAFQNTAALLANIAKEGVEAASKIASAFEAARIGRGSLSTADATDSGLRERLAQLQANIEAGRQWRKEEGNIFERLTGGRDFSAYDSMVEEANRIQQILDTRAGGAVRSGNGRGRGVRVDIRPVIEAEATKTITDRTKATKELTEAEKLWQQVMDDNAMIDEQVAQYHRDAVASEYERLKAIDAGREATQALIADMEFELSLLGMTNRERMQATALRYADVNATDEQIAKIRELANAQYDGERAASQWADVQRSLSDSIYDAVDGTKSLKDTVLDFLDSVNRSLLQSFSDDWAETITKTLRSFGNSGSFGSSGGENWTGTIASLFSSNWGFSSGGYTGNGGRRDVAGVVHGQEYVLNAAATRRIGVANLDAANAGGSMGGTVYNVQPTIVVQGAVDPRTAKQVSIETGREMRVQAARMG